MRAVRSATSLVRHVGSAASEAILVAAIVGMIALVLAPVYGPARFMTGSDNAAAGKTATQYSTLELASTTTKAASTSGLALGSVVLFKAQIYGLKGNENPQVVLSCYASDGTLLYRQMGDPDATFVLGGGTSYWLTLDPAPSATCEARLYGYTYRSIRELTDPSKPLTFHADG